MEAIILAAGEGLRLRPLTLTRPKVMLRVANRPVLEHVVSALAACGVRDIAMVVGYKRERIMSHFEDGNRWKVRISYRVQEKQLGTAHALRHAADAMKGGEFLVLPGDNLIDPATLRNLIDAKGPAALLTESATPSKYGVVKETGGLVGSIVEKPSAQEGALISTGIYRLPASFLGSLTSEPDEGTYDLTNALNRWLGAGGKLHAVRSAGLWEDAVYPWDLLTLNAMALRGTEQAVAGTVEQGVVVKGPVHIGEGSVVKAGTYLEGPLVIGKGCEIGPHACILSSTSLGDNVTIQPFTVVRQSLIMSDVSIGSSSTLSHCVIGDGCSIGPGFASYGEPTSVGVEEEAALLPAEVGAVVGDETKVGSGVVVEAGTIIGAYCKIASHNRLNRNVPSGTLVL